MDREHYDIYCPFDAEKHKKKYIRYLEVLILDDGKVVYAVPSHQEKAISVAADKLGVTREELVAMCPKEYYFDYMTWLLGMSGAIAVWTGGCEAPAINRRQIATLKKFKIMGLYKGTIPKTVGDGGEE